MSSSPTSHPDGSRIDRLLRALVGVADVHIASNSENKLRITVLREGNASEHQLVRNVLSGLKAGFGLTVQPEDVQVVLHLDAWPHRAIKSDATDADTPSRAPATPAAPPARVVADAPRNGNGNGNPHHAPPEVSLMVHGQGNGNGVAKPVADGSVRANGNSTHSSEQSRHSMATPATSYDAAATPLPRPLFDVACTVTGLEPELESIDIERQGASLRCRVSVRVGERIYTAVAEVRDAPTVEAELAARVTLDALRAGGLTNARLDGVTLTTIAETVYVVAAVRPAGAAVPRASAAPLLRTMATAAAVAVLRAQGPIGTDEPRALRSGTI